MTRTNPSPGGREIGGRADDEAVRNQTEGDRKVTELADYQTRVRASEIRAGDFLDQIDPNREIRGPRGGRYRYDGVRVGSRVEKVVALCGGPFGGREEIEVDDEWRPLRLEGFRIYTRQGQITLPGNLADLTTAVVRR
jgi:hypothetical protein